MTDVNTWYKNLPRFTKYWLTATIGVSLLARFGIVNPNWLILYGEAVFKKFQLWRFVTALVYYPISPSTGFHFLMNCFFLYNYSIRLESDHYKSSPSDYLFLLIFNSLCCIMIGLAVELYFLMDPLVLSVLYVWCQLNKDTVVSFWFGTRFQAKYLPWVLLVFNLILTSGHMYSIIGIFVGHLYYFLKFQYPQELGGQQFLNTPSILKNYFPDVSGGVHGFGVPPTNQRPNPQQQQPAGGNRWGGGQWGRGHVLGRD